MILNYLKWFAMACSITGNFFVNQKDVTGMFIWLAGSLTWMAISFKDKKWQELIMFTVYTFYNIQGAYLWLK